MREDERTATSRALSAEALYGRLRTLFSMVCVALGAIVLAGWVFDLPVVRTVLPGLIAMQPPTALCFVAGGLAVFLAERRFLSGGLAFVVLVTAVGTIVAQALGHEAAAPGHALFRAAVDAEAARTGHPGRMAPATAVAFSLIATALLAKAALDRRTPGGVHFAIAASALVLPVISLLGYLLEVRSLRGVLGYTDMALHTAAGMVLLGLACMSTRPDIPWLRLIAERSLAGRAVRWLLPATLILPPLLAWLCLQASKAGLITPEFRLAIVTLVEVWALAFIVLEGGRRLGEAARKLENREREFGILADNINDMVAIRDLDARVLFMSPSSERVLGYTPEELKGTRSTDFMEPEDRAGFEAMHRSLVEGPIGGELRHTMRLRRKDGEVIWVAVSARLAEDENGPLIVTSSRNVNAQVMAQEQLAASETRYRLLTENMTDVVACYSARGIFTYLSPAIERVMGYAPEELIGNMVTDHIHPDDIATSLAMFVSQLKAGPDAPPFRFEYRMRHKDGSWKWLQAQPRAIFDPDTGRFVEWQDVVRDISARREAEEALGESEARYRTLAENVSDILVRFGRDGLVRYISASCRSIGVDPDNAIGQPVMSLLVPGADAERSHAVVEALFTSGTVDRSIRRLHKLRTRDGRDIVLEGRPKLVRDDDGEVIEVVTVLRDVTAQLDIEAALAESEARFRLIAENASDMIMQSAVDGTIIYISPASRALTGYDPEEIVGRTAQEWVHPDDWPVLAQAFQAQVVGKGEAPVEPIEFRIGTKDGWEIWLEARPRATVDPATGEVTGVTDVVRDITERKRLEGELRAAQIEAEAATLVKSEFLANMSHELRTPLTSVVGFTQLIKEQSELSALTRNYVERVGDAGRALLSIVNDILDFSKLEAGQVSFRPEPTGIERLVRGSLELFQPQAGAKDVDLILDAHLPPDLTLVLDPDRLRQVLLNLISNAVKFTETGGVTVALRYAEETKRLRVDVVDSGPGIPEVALDRLFKRFSQVDGSLSRGHGGTGLGLAICKGIVEAMDGEIGVSTELGKGSRFWFEVPVARVDPAQAEGGVAGPDGLDYGLRVLVADDHPANRELVSLFLAGVGAEVTEAGDGEEAAEFAAAWPYDVILMDLRMPKLDGLGAVARIRSERGPNDMTPILAFTADTEPEANQRLLEQGFQGLVTKPLAAQELIAAVAKATAFQPMA